MTERIYLDSAPVIYVVEHVEPLATAIDARLAGMDVACFLPTIVS